MTDSFQAKINEKVNLEAETAAFNEMQRVERGDELQRPQESAQDADPDAPTQEADAPPGASEGDLNEDHDPDLVEATEAPRKGDPSKAIKQLRERAKKAEEEARTAREEAARREGEMRAWQQWAQSQQQVEQPYNGPPDPTEDPIGANQWLVQQELARQQREQQNQLVKQVADTYQADSHYFRQKAPDFIQAYTYAIESRKAELEMMQANLPQNQRMNAAQLMAQIRQEELALAYGAIQSGQNSAEAIYKLAKVRGYRPGMKMDTASLDEHFAQRAEREVSVEKEVQKANAATALKGGGKTRTGYVPDEEGALLQGAAFDKWFDGMKERARAGKPKFQVR